ncbi:unnamed protein product [Didymodactylos carnosus]|uniref:Uncharacterized protein n=1 Tax=Didymodactylos carnosus TaxID=1234261 RepID=A0A814SUD6_9BILA|nr:unnamed protein product [Didymodactylos carnosus]CAF3916471.1 unnamed protein product [Didymodactylos carnosus]
MTRAIMTDRPNGAKGTEADTIDERWKPPRTTNTNGGTSDQSPFSPRRNIPKSLDRVTRRSYASGGVTNNNLSIGTNAGGSTTTNNNEKDISSSKKTEKEKSSNQQQQRLQTTTDSGRGSGQDLWKSTTNTSPSPVPTNAVSEASRRTKKSSPLEPITPTQTSLSTVQQQRLIKPAKEDSPASQSYSDSGKPRGTATGAYLRSGGAISNLAAMTRSNVLKSTERLDRIGDSQQNYDATPFNEENMYTGASNVAAVGNNGLSIYSSEHGKPPKTPRSTRATTSTPQAASSRSEAAQQNSRRNYSSNNGDSKGGGGVDSEAISMPAATFAIKAGPQTVMSQWMISFDENLSEVSDNQHSAKWEDAQEKIDQSSNHQPPPLLTTSSVPQQPTSPPSSLPVQNVATNNLILSNTVNQLPSNTAGVLNSHSTPQTHQTFINGGSNSTSGILASNQTSSTTNGIRQQYIHRSLLRGDESYDGKENKLKEVTTTNITRTEQSEGLPFESYRDNNGSTQQHQQQRSSLASTTTTPDGTTNILLQQNHFVNRNNNFNASNNQLNDHCLSDDEFEQQHRTHKEPSNINEQQQQQQQHYLNDLSSNSPPPPSNPPNLQFNCTSDNNNHNKTQSLFSNISKYPSFIDSTVCLSSQKFLNNASTMMMKSNNDLIQHSCTISCSQNSEHNNNGNNHNQNHSSFITPIQQQGQYISNGETRIDIRQHSTNINSPSGPLLVKKLVDYSVRVLPTDENRPLITCTSAVRPHTSLSTSSSSSSSLPFDNQNNNESFKPVTSNRLTNYFVPAPFGGTRLIINHAKSTEHLDHKNIIYHSKNQQYFPNDSLINYSTFIEQQQTLPIDNNSPTSILKNHFILRHSQSAQQQYYGNSKEENDNRDDDEEEKEKNILNNNNNYSYTNRLENLHMNGNDTAITTTNLNNNNNITNMNVSMSLHDFDNRNSSAPNQPMKTFDPVITSSSHRGDDFYKKLMFYEKNSLTPSSTGGSVLNGGYHYSYTTAPSSTVNTTTPTSFSTATTSSRRSSIQPVTNTPILSSSFASNKLLNGIINKGGSIISSKIDNKTVKPTAITNTSQRMLSEQQQQRLHSMSRSKSYKDLLDVPITQISQFPNPTNIYQSYHSANQPSYSMANTSNSPLNVISSNSNTRSNNVNTNNNNSNHLFPYYSSSFYYNKLDNGPSSEMLQRSIGSMLGSATNSNGIVQSNNDQQQPSGLTESNRRQQAFSSNVLDDASSSSLLSHTPKPPPNPPSTSIQNARRRRYKVDSRLKDSSREGSIERSPVI